MVNTRRDRPVFRDPSGRRARITSRVARGAAIASSMLAAALVLAVLVPPLLPRVVVAGDGATPIPRFAGTRLSRARLAAKRRLYAAIAGQPQAPAVRRSALPPRPASRRPTGRRRGARSR